MSEHDPERTAEDVPLPGGDFRMFVTRLGFQGMLSLGLLENPVTGETRLDRHQARMLIDDLAMLRERTQGNLSVEEAEHLDKILGDLRQHWLSVASESDELLGPES